MVGSPTLVADFGTSCATTTGRASDECLTDTSLTRDSETIIEAVVHHIKRIKEVFALPKPARREKASDRCGVPDNDPGVDTVIELGVRWLGLAQDCSPTRDGGVARHFSLLTGWGSSYPETTGYIVPTLINYWRRTGDVTARNRARRMTDWLASIQFGDGSFQGGIIGSTPVVPVTFNTGQILLGLAAGVREFDDYAPSMCQAADWLVQTLDSDGCWRRHPTPFAMPGEKAYETHAAWGLIEAARLVTNRGYGEAALANVRWALTKQHPNGWVEQCCLSDSSRPLTHTLGYFLRGVLEAYRFTRDRSLLEAAKRTGSGLLSALEPDGRLPGRLFSNWTSAAPWVCLTGSAQVAHCWLMLFQDTGDASFLDAALRTNRFVRRTIKTRGPEEAVGAVKGSVPIDGEYGRFEYLNWATKFCIDAQMLEKTVQAEAIA
jgi:hypothetical protein